MVFWDYPEPWVIWVTVTWWFFSWPPKSREIVEFDILFDEDFTWWDASINSNLMDYQNIATHELWHGLWLADLYTWECAEETMYGYSGNWDIIKRSLNSWDIVWIQSLYWE